MLRTLALCVALSAALGALVSWLAVRAATSAERRPPSVFSVTE